MKRMASPTSLLSENQFQCSVCLDVFTDPVTTPCGHTFCMACIRGLWKISYGCKCPTCENTFTVRPQISINVAFKEITDQFKRIQVGVSNLTVAKPGEVACDVCTGGTIKALKSCLVCLTSYCEPHLEPHKRVATLKVHKLIDPVEKLEDRMCKKHEKLLESFCKTDQMCVCQFCTETCHKTHHTVAIEEECGEKKAQIKKMESGVQQMIQVRQKKVEEIKHSMELSRITSKKEMEDGAQIFTALVKSIERSQAELNEGIEEKQSAAERRAEGLVKELEQEITELQRRSTELEQLSITEDHLHLLQSLPSLCTTPPTKDWSEISVDSDMCVGNVRRALSQLEDTLKNELETLKEREFKRIQKYAVDVTLDPDTAHPNIVLSSDCKQARRGDMLQILPDNPQRFDPVLCILGKRGFSIGRFYFEVQVGDKTYWDLGVVRGSVNRKGMITSTPENGYWTIRLRGGEEYRALASPSILLSLGEKPQKVGVFVDYEEGLVSFYDVEAKAHIYSFTGFSFTERLYPFLSPSVSDDGKNSAPLVISPVNHEG
ncbi:E3 ubiquitin-protein ligase TRIM39 [Oncorhynchus tshawytscha]|uniref:E3 ubiquitin-protein ligase TRIM39-like n=1 Tax=Oncorhynchus tshawytscha TaxID=74940 RepID=A0A8C8MJS6_ONCTS|nr:E3 ubiquitin-protein ligase TRIM39 [Oncorhynchus tshawytscha]